MYSHCIFCAADLGTNEAIEEFQVGRRLAFDADKGRLWVVCRACERWNLSPLEVRWEAIEAAERRFHDTRVRFSTENVGLARLPDGTELVRVGRPKRPEFAAWRYGDQFGRRRRTFLIGAVGLGTLGAGLALGSLVVVGGSALVIPLHLYNLGRAVKMGLGAGAVIRDDDGVPIEVPEMHYGAPKIRPSDEYPGGWYLDLGKIPGETRILSGPAAVEALSVLLPKVNTAGAGRGKVASAVRQIEEAGHPEAYFREVELRARKAGWGYGTLATLPHEIRLATEMAAHEEHERSALEGELARLEAAWQEAEQVAAIADDLTLPDSIRTRLQRLKGSTQR